MSKTVRVIQIEVGGITYTDASFVAAMTELQEMFEAGYDEAGYEGDITLRFREMDEAEYDALPEFDGF